MAMVKKSITVTDRQEAWIQAQLAKGNYATDSEIVREAIREKQERLEEIEIIRAKLMKAEASGFTDKSAEEIRAELKEEMRRNGEL